MRPLTLPLSLLTVATGVAATWFQFRERHKENPAETRPTVITEEQLLALKDRLARIRPHRFENDFASFVRRRGKEVRNLSRPGRLQLLIDYDRKNPLGEALQAEVIPLLGTDICFNLGEFDFPVKDQVHTAAPRTERETGWKYLPIIKKSLPNCRTEEQILQVMDDLHHIGGSEAKETLREIVTNHCSDSPRFAEKFLRLEATFTHDPALNDMIRRAILNLIPEDQEPPDAPYRDPIHNLILSAILRVREYTSTDPGVEPFHEFIDALIRERPNYQELFARFQQD
ncbi:MAG: hypothetical protein HYW02_02465 [Deltaproteobacteria bacterium]|nr:hypothetical protein [Deltaproteobacteria bacterium]